MTGRGSRYRDTRLLQGGSRSQLIQDTADNLLLGGDVLVEGDDVGRVEVEGVGLLAEAGDDAEHVLVVLGDGVLVVVHTGVQLQVVVEVPE